MVKEKAQTWFNISCWLTVVAVGIIGNQRTGVAYRTNIFTRSMVRYVFFGFFLPQSFGCMRGYLLDRYIVGVGVGVVNCYFVGYKEAHVKTNSDQNRTAHGQDKRAGGRICLFVVQIYI